jgi:hypothetical protein
MNQPPDQPWIRSFALRPMRMSNGAWVWLKPYEWRWGQPSRQAPSAVSDQRLEFRAYLVGKAPHERS